MENCPMKVKKPVYNSTIGYETISVLIHVHSSHQYVPWCPFNQTLMVLQSWPWYAASTAHFTLKASIDILNRHKRFSKKLKSLKMLPIFWVELSRFHPNLCSQRSACFKAGIFCWLVMCFLIYSYLCPSWHYDGVGPILWFLESICEHVTVVLYTATVDTLPVHWHNITERSIHRTEKCSHED